MHHRLGGMISVHRFVLNERSLQSHRNFHRLYLPSNSNGTAPHQLFPTQCETENYLLLTFLTVCIAGRRFFLRNYYAFYFRLFVFEYFLLIFYNFIRIFLDKPSEINLLVGDIPLLDKRKNESLIQRYNYNEEQILILKELIEI